VCVRVLADKLSRNTLVCMCVFYSLASDKEVVATRLDVFRSEEISIFSIVVTFGIDAIVDR